MGDWARERHPTVLSSAIVKRTFLVRISRLQSAGPPQVIRRSMSHVLEAKLVTGIELVVEKTSRFARGDAPACAGRLERTPTTSSNPLVGPARVRLQLRTERGRSDTGLILAGVPTPQG